MGTLAEHGTWTVLGQAFAVHLDTKDAVEDQVHLRALVALADKGGARLHLPDLRFGRAVHQLIGERAFERGLDDGDEGLRLLVAPGRRLAEGLAVPVLEVDEPGLAREPAVLVVDPVTREPARPAQHPLGPSVGVHRETERGPGERRLPLDEGGPPHASWGGHAGAAAGGLGKAHPAFAPLGLALDVGQRHRLEHVAQPTDADRRAADLAARRVAGVLDPARAVDLYPGRELVGEAEPVGLP